MHLSAYWTAMNKRRGDKYMLGLSCECLTLFNLLTYPSGSRLTILQNARTASQSGSYGRKNEAEREERGQQE